MKDLIERLDNAGPDDDNLFDLCMESFIEIERLTAVLDSMQMVNIKKAETIERLNALVALQKKDMKQAMDDNQRLQANVEKLEGALNRIANGHGLQRDIGIAVNALAATEQGESDE